MPRGAAGSTIRSGLQGLGAASLTSVGVSGERVACVSGAVPSLTPGDDCLGVVELEIWQSCVSAPASAVSPSEKGVRLSKVASAGSTLLRRCAGR